MAEGTATASVGAPVAVRVEQAEGIAVLILDAGPDNRLGPDLRGALAATLDAVTADPGVVAVVLMGEGGRFATEATDGAAADGLSLGDVCAQVEGAARPVVSALHGRVTDGALELALAATARVAEAGARLAFAAVRTGLCPGAGGTQRLPRRVGMAAALDLLISGREVTAAEALVIGLVDQVVEGQDALLLAALDLAAELGGLPAPPAGGRGPGLHDLPAQMAAMAVARAAARSAPIDAPRRIVDCVEAALLLPFAQGLDFEAAVRADLLARPEHAALTAVARAEARQTGGATPLHEAVVAGAAGADLAGDLLAAGLSVTLADPDRAALVAGLGRIAGAQGAAVVEGRMTEAARDADWARLTPAQAVPAATECLVLAGLPTPQVEAGVVVMLGGPGAPGAVGLILHADGLAEVLLRGDTAPGAGDAVAGLLRRTGRVALAVGGGGIVAAMRGALQAVAAHEVARVGGQAVAAALAACGLPVVAVPDGVLAEGQGAGPSGPVAPRIMAALANAGLRLIGDGVVDRPGDIDLALVHGMGLPRHVPGPMLWAAQRGLLVLRADLRRWEGQAPDLWTPAPLIDAMLRRGTRIDDLEG